MEPPRKRLKFQEKEEKSIFDILPEEIRQIIIGFMDFWTILNFAKCSTKCREEAKMFGNSIKSLEICEVSNRNEAAKLSFVLKNNWKMSISFQWQENTKAYGHFHVFEAEYRKSWTKIGENGENPKIMAAKYLNLILKMATNSVIEISCRDENFLYDKVNFKNLKKIGKIEILFKNEFNFITKQQLFKIKNGIDIDGIKLGLDEIIQVKSKILNLPATKLKIEEVNQFLKYWKNGKLTKNMRLWSFGIAEEFGKLDHEKLLEGLEIERFENDNQMLIGVLNESIDSKLKIFIYYAHLSIDIFIPLPKTPAFFE
ncbi:unnamed protein product [Caenorhabditis angaria]|uniref:F-box domain-containing protein n=1 Tax=Caenorhabditis angaria TaxID=860376 RepID=A0A9P1I896_9PELO|nr:unnamed protein product [Caenorhabditis angaria]